MSEILRLHPRHQFREPIAEQQRSDGWCGHLLGIEGAQLLIDQTHAEIERHRAAGTLRKLLSTYRDVYA